jgi:hypothetical protein
MSSSAMMRGVPIIPHVDLDATLSEIIDHVITKAFEVVDRGVGVANEKVLERAAEAIGRPKAEGTPTHETVS